MRFQVPQFIDIEDKIFGPFTFKQFLYLAGGAGGSYAIFRALPIYISILLILPILGVAIALAFAKINGKPFVEILEAWFAFTFKSKLFIWKQRKAEKKRVVEKKPVAHPMANIPRLTESRLTDLSWSLDVLDLQQKDK